MRLDRFFSHLGLLSRSESRTAIKEGRIRVGNTAAVKCDMQIDENSDDIFLDGKKIIYRNYTYIMMNKPSGFLSATEDGKDKTVIDLLSPELQRIGLFPCGRLDKDTVGLLILTNDGKTAHNNLSPKHHCEKRYYFKLRDVFSSAREMEKGIKIEKDTLTLPCKVEMTGDKEGYITLTEGKYHQIKKMFDYFGNSVIYLKRTDFAGIPLDDDLKEGEYRMLTEDEEKRLIAND